MGGMGKLFILFVLAIITKEAVGMTFRTRWQATDEGENSLEDRYGWDRPRRPWQRPQNQWDQSPNQGGDQQWPLPDQGGQNQGGQQPQNPNGNESTTQLSGVGDCIRKCPSTPEYNPVCGTNNITYTNPGRLTCAQWCGVDVEEESKGRCLAKTCNITA